MEAILNDLLKALPADSPRPAQREPVHVIYGGAHLFRPDTPQKLGRIAAGLMLKYLPTEADLQALFAVPEHICPTVYSSLARKLGTEAIEDLRIDFEDGYGIRTDEEEDGHAASAAAALASAMADGLLPPFCGFRVKALSRESGARSARTLEIFTRELASRTEGKLPPNFVVTLPKVEHTEQVATLAKLLDTVEAANGIPAGSIRIEVMVESPRSLIGRDGSMVLGSLIDAANGRCVAAHFGAYDHMSSCGITAADQRLSHPACDLARGVMQLSLAGTGVRLADGATNTLPIPPHRGEDISPEQEDENRAVIHRAWRAHFDDVRRSLSQGFYLSWDLHPGQLVSRYAAVYSFFLEQQDVAAERLRNFVDQAARATLVGDTFDDAATGQGLLNFFVRAVNCGAMTKDEAVSMTGLSMDELLSGSFSLILRNRRSI